MTPEQVQTAFLTSYPAISKSILDLSTRHANFAIDLPEVVTLEPDQNEVEQIIFRYSQPDIERGLSKWNLLASAAGCDPCTGPGCDYNMTMLPGHAWERKKAGLGKREFRSPDYCIEDIQNTKDYMEVFAKVVDGLFRQTQFIKEQNIVFNILTSLSKKFVVDGEGPQGNPENPYVYRNLQGVKSGNLNMDLLEIFYEWMVRMPGVIEYDMADGAPIFGLMASREVINQVYKQDPELRNDVRFSPEAQALLGKYNFTSVMGGMFIPAPILYPRRFKLDASGDPVEVIPFVNGIPAEIGTYTGLNPEWFTAPYEEVILTGRKPFSLITKPTLSTLGQGTSFGPEPSWLNEWQWINPQTSTDPLRRSGYFLSVIKMGLLPQHSEGLFAVLVERKSQRLAVKYNPEPMTPPVEVESTNTVPAVECPTPLILSVVPHPLEDDQYFVTFSAPLDESVKVEDTILLGTNDRAYLAGEVIAIKEDGLVATVEFVEGTVVDCSAQFTRLFTDDTLGCFSQVVSYAVNASDATRLDLVLSDAIKADESSQVVTVYYGNGTTVSATVVSVNMSTKTWVVDIGSTNFADNVDGVIAVCVPTSTDASCAACGAALATVTQCS